MAYPRVEKIDALWLGRRGVAGARFVRHQLGREWIMDVPLKGHVTVSEAGALLSRDADTVRGWIQAGTIQPPNVATYVAEDGSQTIVLPVAAVREMYRELYGRYPNQ